MQTSSQPKLLSIPFASGGSKQDIPNDSQIGITAGRASYTDGFPPLTRTPLAAGGVPPFGTDFNGVLNDITAAIRWSQAGAGYPFDATFNTAVSGYPKGAKIPNSTLDGFWLNTVDGNSTNPENTTSALTGWVPSDNYGTTAITGLSGSSLTLTTLQASRKRITLSGTLTANINLVVPAWQKKWAIVNNCSGSFSVTVKTPSGTGIATSSGSIYYLIGDGVNIISDFGTAAFKSIGVGTNQIPDMNSFTKSFGDNGYQKLPGGLIIQWGQSSLSDSNGSASATFPIAFPAAVMTVQMSEQSSNVTAVCKWGSASLSLTGASFWCQNSGATTARSGELTRYFVIGY